ncbi:MULTISPECIES: hypothetical protein, partial [unclassified Frankia]|uniref:hypothetical protein n=1 Tax=unclassified Frankia TaxID=2632575 RepID=UPI002AD3D12D
ARPARFSRSHGIPAWVVSFLMTNIPANEPEGIVAVEWWFRGRADIETQIKDAKLDAGLRHEVLTVPGRVVPHARGLHVRLPPSRGDLLSTALARLRALPAAT